MAVPITAEAEEGDLAVLVVGHVGGVRAGIQRDRAAEFTATGDVAGLLRRTEHARRRLQEDMVGLSAAAPPVNVRRDPNDPVPYTETKGAVLVHVLEELFQHVGQMELTRDALVVSRRR